MLPDPDELAGRVLCQVEDLAATKAKDVIIKNGDEQYSIMVVQWKGYIRAFVNSCPHARVPLNMLGDTFFDLTGNYLLCTMHGAHFRRHQGHCHVDQDFTVKVRGYGGQCLVMRGEGDGQNHNFALRCGCLVTATGNLTVSEAVSNTLSSFGTSCRVTRPDHDPISGSRPAESQPGTQGSAAADDCDPPAVLTHIIPPCVGGRGPHRPEL